MKLHTSTDVACYRNQVLLPHEHLHGVSVSKQMRKFFAELAAWLGTQGAGAARRLGRQAHNNGMCGPDEYESGR